MFFKIKNFFESKTVTVSYIIWHNLNVKYINNFFFLSIFVSTDEQSTLKTLNNN